MTNYKEQIASTTKELLGKREKKFPLIFTNHY